MKTIFIPEHYLRMIFNSLTIKEDVRSVLNTIITRYDHDYSKFMYGMFSAYSKVAVSLTDEHCELSRREMRDAMQRLTLLKHHINPSNIFVADKFDLLYGVSCTGDLRNVKFKDFMYEDMYSRMENLIGALAADEYMEDIFESIEHVAGMIEGNLISIAQTIDEEKPNVVFYIDVINSGLLFILI